MSALAAEASYARRLQEEIERDYRRTHPDWAAPFADALGHEDPDLMRPDEPPVQPAGAAGPEEEEASEAQAATAAARQLLDGPLLSDIVALHAAVFGALGLQKQQQQGGGGLRQCDSQSVRAAFLQRYQLGAQLLAVLGPGGPGLGPAGPSGAQAHPLEAAAGWDLALGPEADAATATGHLFR